MFKEHPEKDSKAKEFVVDFLSSLFPSCLDSFRVAQSCLELLRVTQSCDNQKKTKTGDRRTDGRADGRTDLRTDGQTLL